jgi:3-hydroxyisobutyrate dehydrogenase-like beta-hydroxyacid dehydrogenase
MKIGLIGLGTMGAGMAENLHKAGLDLRVCNRSESKLAPFAEQGVPTTTHPRDLADCDVVLTMLADDAALKAVLFDSGLMQALSVNAIHCSCSTISLNFAKKLKAAHEAHGSTLLCSPVSGRGDLARAGSLFLIVAGNAEATQSCAPLFEAMGQRTYHFGEDPLKAVVVKLAINQMIASSLVVMAESISIVEQHGISSEAFVDFFANALFAAPVFKAYGPLIAKRAYQPANFPVNLGLKDLRLAQEAASAVGEQPVVAQAVRELMESALQAGLTSSDWAAVAEMCRPQP